MDAAKEGDERKAGDYLVWAQILDYSAKSDKPVLFVTKDQKEDWFERFAGEMTGPRIELVAEFGEHSQKGYHQVTLGRFLDLANEFLRAKVDKTTIDRVSAESELVSPETLEAVRRTAWLISPETLEEARRASLLISPETLEAARRASLLISPETLEAARRTAWLISPETLEAAQGQAGDESENSQTDTGTEEGGPDKDESSDGPQ